MFKKLKDKIAEEVKQSPLRLPTSVQQHLSQYSPFTRESNNGDGSESLTHVSGIKENNPVHNRTQETLVDIAEDSGETTSNQFSIGDNESRSTSPSANRDGHFLAVNLNESKRENTSTPQPASQGRLSRQSSLSSVFSDVSFLPGSLDSTYHPYQFQSDLESNVSEFDESASQSSQSVDRISKEHVFNAYKKMRMRYHKYKGRYADLARHYKELEREREKVKHVLTETQDRSLRRISELKEQCALEQQAKAHLEENLRSDLEEKDNMIAVLRTKVKLLASPQNSSVEGMLLDLSTSNTTIKSLDETNKDKKEGESSLTSENEVTLLKEKLQRFESLLLKCKENIKNQNDRNSELQTENESLKQSESRKNTENESLQKAHREQLTQLTESLNMARREIETLRHQEQEAALASAETKQKVHAELLKQEEEMIRLRSERDQLNSKVAQMEVEIKNVKEEMTKQLQEAETVLELEKQKLLKELSRGKTEALKLMDEDMDHRLEDLRKEKDTYWEVLLQKKLAEEAESHARALRQAEEHYRSRLTELQEEKTLALEEKELHFASLQAREQNTHQGLQAEIVNLKREIEIREKLVEKVKEEGVDERRSWVQQIEDNRQRHLEEIQALTLQNEKHVEEIKQRHKHTMDTTVLELKQKHSKELEKIQQQHEELLQAANEDIESSVKNQLEQLRTLLRDKELELSQSSASLLDLQEQLKSRHTTIENLEMQINHLEQQVSSNESLSEKLHAALEEAKQIEPLSLELMNARHDLSLVTTCIRQLEEEASALKESAKVDHDEQTRIKQQLEESAKEHENVKQQCKELTNKIEENEKRIALLTVLEKENENLKELLDDKQQAIVRMQAKIEEVNVSMKVKEQELDLIREELSGKLQGVQSDLDVAKLALETKIEEIAKMKLAQSLLCNSESHLKNIIEEKEQRLSSITSELQELKDTFERDLLAMQVSLNDKEERISQLYEDTTMWQQKSLELANDLKNTQSALEASMNSAGLKERRILELEEAESLRNTEENKLKIIADERAHQLNLQQIKIEEMQQLVEQKEKQIVELQQETEMTVNHLKATDLERESCVQELNNKLERARAEVEEIKTLLNASNRQVLELEQVQSSLMTERSQLEASVQDKERELLSQVLKSENLAVSHELKEKRNADLEEEIATISNLLTDTRSELKHLRDEINAKNERVLELEQAQNRWNSEECSFKESVEDYRKRLLAKESEMETLQESIQLKETRVIELQQELEQINNCLTMQDNELKQSNRDLSEVLKAVQSELQELKTQLDSKESLIKDLEQFKHLASTREAELQATVEEKHRFLSSKESDLQEKEKELESKNQQIANMQSEIDEARLSLTTLSSDWEHKLSNLSVLLESTRSELDIVNSNLKNKEQKIFQLEEEIRQRNKLTEESQQKLAGNEIQLNSVKDSLSQRELEIARLKEAQSTLETSLKESSRELAEKESELDILRRSLEETNDFKSSLSEAKLKLESRENELKELRVFVSDNESKINSLESSIEETAKILVLKESELEALNYSLAVKESVILDLQGEVERNGLLLSESETSVEEHKHQLRLLKESLNEKNAITEQLKSQLSSGKTELDRITQSMQEFQLQLATKEEAIQEMVTNHRVQIEKIIEDSSTTTASSQLLEKALTEKQSKLECCIARTVELESELATKQAEKELLQAEYVKLKQDLESRDSQTTSIEQMENQIKSLNEEVSSLTEDKTRLENLCKRFKVQLADTRKILSLSKAAEATVTTESQIVSPPKVVEPTEVKGYMQVEADQNRNQTTTRESDAKEQLQQQLAVLQKELEIVRHQHKMEAAELRRLVELGKTPAPSSSGTSNGANNFHGSLEEATELEYLRNILFEYMMGRQPATLAKVVAAVVKFTPEQTRKINEREEQRQGLLGHLGFA